MVGPTTTTPYTLPDGRVIQVPSYPAPAPPASPMVGPTTPHTLPGGRVIQVPSHLAPAPPASPMGAWGPVDVMQMAAQFAPSPEAAQAAEMRAQLAPPGSEPAAPPEPPGVHPSQPGRFEQLSQLGQDQGIDPSQRVTPGGAAAPTQQRPGAPGQSGISDSVREVMAEAGRGGGGPRRPGGLQVASKKLEITPGRELVPELKWQMGLEGRPQELDPEQPFDAENPAMRGVETPLTQGATKAGVGAVAPVEAQFNAQREHNNAEKDALVQHSQLLDDQLNQISQKRARVAQLQQVADQRMQEARSQEPRTRGEIWESKGNLARGMAILAAVLGGAAAGLRGGPNLAWQMIEKNIDDTVNGERYAAEKRMRLGLEAKGDFAQAMRLYGDLDAATLENRQRKLQSMIGIIDAQSANRGLDASQQQILAATRQEAENKYLMGAQQLYDMLNGKVEKESVELKNQPATGGGGAATKLKVLEAGAKATKYEDEILRRKKGAGAGSPAERASLNNAEAALVPLEQLLQRYKGADDIPGVQDRSGIGKGISAAGDFVFGNGAGTQALTSQDERINRMIVKRASLAYQHEMTGAGASNEERASLEEAFAGVKTVGELRAAVLMAKGIIARHRGLLDGQPSDAQETQIDPDAQPVE